MSRLPTPGQDSGAWGELLNDFLLREHNADGSLRVRVELQSGYAKLDTNAKVVANQLPEATTSSEGVVMLAGDLAGTANTPMVPALAAKVQLGGDIVSSVTSPVVAPAYNPDAVTQNNSNDTLITSFQVGHGFSVISANGSQSADTNTYIKGTQSLKISTNGLNNPTSTQKNDISPTINLTSKQIKIRIMVDKPTNITELYVYFSSDNVTANWFTVKPSNYITVLKSNVWTTLTFSQGRDTQATGTPNKAAINSLAVRVRDDGTTPVNLWINEISYFDQPASGVVTFTFDDNKLSQYTTARPILDKYDYPATAYTIPSKVGTSNYMSLTQLQTIARNGWDVSNHTQTHPFLSQLTDAQVDAEFYLSKQWLLQNGFTKGASDMALPHGDYDDGHVLPIARKYFRSVRTINNQVETYPAADYFKLRTLYMTTSLSLAAAKTAVDQAIANKEWLILTFHDIETPTTAPESWTVADFTSLVDYINAAGAVVKTMADVVTGTSGSIGAVASGADATTTSKGVVKLANNLSGTADAPTVVSTSLTAALPVNQGGTGITTVTTGNVVTVASATNFATSKTAPAGAFVGTSDTQTVSNKRITKRTNTIASSATPAITTDTTDEFTITALATNITSMSSSLTGTPNNGDDLTIRIKDNGTIRTITWGTSFMSSGMGTLLATTVANKTHYVKLRYDSTATKWICIAADASGY